MPTDPITPTQIHKEKIRETWLFRGRLTRGILLIASALVIFFITWVVFVYTKSSADQHVFDLIRPHITATRTRVILLITFLGNPQFLVPLNILLLIFFLIMKKNWMALRLTFVSLGGLLVKLLLKQLFHRVRPPDPVIVGGVSGYSYPSGHALLGVVFYGFLIWWAAITIRNKFQQGMVIGFLLLLIIAVCFSRIYLRVHYTTDILTGICLGFTWLIYSLWQVDKIEIRHHAKLAPKPSGV